MPELDPVAQAFALFARLRDQRTHHCDYRHTELAAFRLAVAELARPIAGTDRQRKRKSRVAPAVTTTSLPAG